MACTECEDGPEGRAGYGAGGRERCPACGDASPAPPESPAHPLADGKSHRTAAAVAMALLGVCAAADLFSLYAGSRLVELIDADAFSWTGEPERAEWLYRMSGVVRVAAMVAAAVAFVVWFRRSRTNAGSFGAGSRRMDPGWAIGGRLVPVVDLWFPKRIANDIRDAGPPPGAERAAGVEGPRGPLNGWWALWILTTVLGRVASTAHRDAETLTEIQDAVTFHLVADGVNIAAAVLAVLVVRGITAVQHALREHRAALAAAPL
ncbi:DUF4328 domain-containing protein [Streptomyces sp. DH37]|uniref:DUF4328 domain-containing protein n=1 Tax=Streptomyces sp. DH37 TaxID=3040122 RepID=UPI002441EA91|nr:DUF4328 domain-containing protein [Streptomyces sp. DH37]MDG9702081.1 DUF4328 domain-containing protein [Streptomyces sp. DH37]